MTTMATALEHLYADIESTLAAMVPDARPELRFARRQPQDEELRALAQTTGRARLFEIKESEIKLSRLYYTGGGTSGIEITVPVEVLYPTHDPRDAASWQAAAISDWTKLHHACYDTQPTAGGVQSRVVESTPALVPFGDDPWMIMRFEIRALLDVEQ